MTRQRELKTQSATENRFYVIDQKLGQESYRVDGKCAYCDNRRGIANGFWWNDAIGERPNLICDHCADDQDERFERFISAAGYNERIKDCVINRWIDDGVRLATHERSSCGYEDRCPDAWKYLRGRLDNPQELFRYNWFLHGPSGTGKTYYAYALMNLACRHGFTIAEIEAATFASEYLMPSTREKVMWVVKPDLLLIDDVTVSIAQWSDKSAPGLWRVLNQRKKHGRFTILTSNDSPSEWYAKLCTASKANLTASALDRLNPMRKFEWQGKSIRREF